MRIMVQFASLTYATLFSSRCNYRASLIDAPLGLKVQFLCSIYIKMRPPTRLYTFVYKKKYCVPPCRKRLMFPRSNTVQPSTRNCLLISMCTVAL